jgi:WD40 repeat protein
LSQTDLAFSSFRIWIYNTLRDDVGKHFVGHSNFVRAIEFDKKKGWLISGGEDCTLRFWNYESCDNFKTISIGCPLLSLDFWEAEYVVCGGADCSIYFFDMNMLRLVTKKKCKIFPTQVKVLKDSRIVYTEYNS